MISNHLLTQNTKCDMIIMLGRNDNTPKHKKSTGQATQKMRSPARYCFASVTDKLEFGGVPPETKYLLSHISHPISCILYLIS